MHSPPNSDIDRSDRSSSSLADVLADPETEWSDVREALKAHARGSFLGSGGTVSATTNASLIEALRESSGVNGFGGAAERNSCGADEEDDWASRKIVHGRAHDPPRGRSPGEESKNFTDVGEQKEKDNGEGYHSLVVSTFKGESSKESSRTPVPENRLVDKTIKGRSSLVPTSKASNSRRLSNEVNSLIDSIINNENSKGSRSRQAPPLRQLSRAGSPKSGSRQGSVKDGIGNFEAHKDELDNSATEPQGCQLSPQCRRNSMPERRLPLRSSAKCASRRGSLRDVKEDAEADMNEPIDLKEYGPSKVPGDGCQSILSSRRLPSRSSRKSINTSISSSRSSRKSILENLRQFSSKTSMSSCSVNMMDFGVDHNRRQSLTSLGELSNDSTNTSTSKLVDESGFLGWGHDSASASSTSRSRHPILAKRGPVKRSESCDTDSSRSLSCLLDCPGASEREPGKRSDMDSSSFSNLVDSVGFMGWQKCDSDPRNLGASTNDTASAEEDKEKQVFSDVAEDEEASEKPPDKPMEDWRIEDYEGLEDLIGRFERTSSNSLSDSGRVRSRNSLSCRVKRLVDKTARRNIPSAGSGASRKVIGTDDIKRFLLTGRPIGDGKKPREHAASCGAAHDSSFGSFFGRGESSNSNGKKPREHAASCGAARDASLGSFFLPGRGEPSAGSAGKNPQERATSEETRHDRASFGSFFESGRRTSDGKWTKPAPPPRDHASFGSFFESGRRTTDGSSSLDDEYYSRPIRIHPEDDVDIGMLRRELCGTGGKKENRARGRRNNGFGIF